MPYIWIDDEVMHVLQEHAIKINRIFGTENEVLRDLLGMDNDDERNARGHSTSPTATPVASSIVQPGVGYRSSLAHVSSKRLLEHHPELRKLGWKSYAHVGGANYNWPTAYPAIYFGPEGYVLFQSHQAMLNACSHLAQNPNAKRVYIPEGISSLRGYVKCPPECGHRRLYRKAP